MNWGFFWWWRWESNPRLPACKADRRPSGRVSQRATTCRRMPSSSAQNPCSAGVQPSGGVLAGDDRSRGVCDRPAGSNGHVRGYVSARYDALRNCVERHIEPTGNVAHRACTAPRRSHESIAFWIDIVGPAVSRASLQADLANAQQRAVRLAARAHQLEQRLSEALGEQAWHESGLGVPVGIDQLKQQIGTLTLPLESWRVPVTRRDVPLGWPVSRR